MLLGLVHVNMGPMSQPGALVAAAPGGRVMLGVGAGYLEPEFHAQRAGNLRRQPGQETAGEGLLDFGVSH
jgi:hypothetical protein